MQNKPPGMMIVYAIALLFIPCGAGVCWASPAPSRLSICRALVAKLNDKPFGLWTPNDTRRKQDCDLVLADKKFEDDKLRDERTERDGAGVEIGQHPPSSALATDAENATAKADVWVGNFGFNNLRLYKGGSLMDLDSHSVLGSWRDCKDDTGKGAQVKNDHVFLCQYHAGNSRDPNLTEGEIVRVHTGRTS